MTSSGLMLAILGSCAVSSLLSILISPDEEEVGGKATGRDAQEQRCREFRPNEPTAERHHLER